MKLNFTFFFIILFLAALIPFQTKAVNIIPNPGFELGSGDDFTNWSKWNGSASLIATTTEGEYRSGTRALKAVVASNGDAWSVQLVSDLITTVIGESYTFKIYVKGAVAGTNIRFSTNPDALYSPDFTVTTDWTEFSWTFTANATQTRVVLDLGANANTYYLDDMDMQEPVTDAPNVIPNPGFEAGTGDDFDNWSKWNGASSLIATTTAGEYRSGSRALKAVVASNGNAWDVQMVSDLIPTIFGETYTFRIYVKGLTAGTNIRFSTNPNAMYSPNFTITTDWQLLSWTFTANSTETRIALDLGANANTYFLDDMEMLAPVTEIQNLLLNGGFEGGSGDDFSNWSKWNGAASLLATTTEGEFRTGSRALKAVVASNGDPWSVQLASDPVTTVVGASYSFNVYVKGATSGTSIRFSTNPEAQYSPDFMVTGDWTRLSWTFVANAPQTRILLDLGANANTYFIDDATLEVICGLTRYSPPADQLPIASGKNKFIGTVYSASDPDINKYFNQITPENEGKWGSIETSDGVFNWANIEAARQYAKDNNFPFRFHVLVWGSQQPTWLKPLSDEEKVIRIKRWFQSVAEHFDGSSNARAVLEYVEVANEILNDPPDNSGSNATDNGSGGYLDALRSLNSELGTTPGEFDWVINAFKLARQYFPCETKLMLNEYRVENEPSWTARYAQVIQLLKDEDLIDVIGMQAHSFNTQKYGSGPYEDATNNLRTNLNTLAALGLPIMLTEFDIDGNVSDENGNRVTTGTDAEKDEFQRSEYERIFGLYWNHPSVIGITLWGYRPGMWRTAQAAYLVDPCTGAERPAMSQYLNSVIRNGENPPLNPLFAPVLNVLPVLTVTPDSQQYSDKVELKITIENGALRCGVAAESATFTLSNGTGHILGSADFITNGVNLEAKLDVSLLDIPDPLLTLGTKTISATINGVDNSQYSVDPIASQTLEILPENAELTFTGPQIVATENCMKGQAVLTLRSTVRDISVTPNANGDVDFGDIRKAKVRFLNNGTPIVISGKTDENGWINNNIILVDQQDIRTGIISVDWPVNIGSAGEKQFNITVEAGGLYTGSINTSITVYKSGVEMITGAGNIKTNNSAGKYASSSNNKVNFVFSIKSENCKKGHKYHKPSDDLKGLVYFDFYSNQKHYLITSNSIASVGVKSSGHIQKAVFVSVARLEDITKGRTLIGNNLTLQVYVADKGMNGKNDEIAVTLYSGDSLWYSSKWTGTDTDPVKLNSGNIIVLSKRSSGSKSTVENELTDNSNDQVQAPLTLKAWPNPTNTAFSLDIQSEDQYVALELFVYDINGKLVYSKKGQSSETFIFGENFSSGTYLLYVRQGEHWSSLQLIKE